MEYYIFVTNNCNLDCNYCSGVNINKNNCYPEKPSYSIGQLKEFIIKTQKTYNDNEINILFFGGEPTLDYDYIFKVIQEIGFVVETMPVKYILHTNGILLDKIPLEILSALNRIIISINYEKIPSYGLYNSYFAKIINNINYIRQLSNITILGRLTITEKVSVYTNVMQVLNFFDYVHWQIENCYTFNRFEDFSKTYIYETKLLYQVWINSLRKGSMLNIIPFMSMVRLLMKIKKSSGILCGFNYGSVYVQTNGNCYSCSEEMNNSEFYIGSVSTLVNFGSFTCKESICVQKSCFEMCYGRCGRMHLKFSNNHINEYCELNRAMISLFEKDKDDIIRLVSSQLSALNDPIFELTECIP
ncbi:radical SAM protein [Heliobacterium chlorum]|uniref:Radical SAM protein n=1 Tax=Heliobacterium chlorum TaxID=2698 RepID=A0ABR7T5P3_HELCL|nr:radical SAM protein [Heliobacterium chlorum]MBC9786093.1 radical SAM protein [Heliobacterium chlorum]